MSTLGRQERGARESAQGRDRLLDLVADHVLEHGTTGQSLSGLARAVGSNNRMLLYYFGRKEDLLDEACQRAVLRFPRVVGALDGLRGPEPLAERLHAAWREIAHPDNRPFLQLFFERYGAALREPEGNVAYLERMGFAGWPAQVAEVLRSEGFAAADARRCALEVVALWRGLQLSLLSGVPSGELDVLHAAAARRLAAEPSRNRPAPRS